MSRRASNNVWTVGELLRSFPRAVVVFSLCFCFRSDNWVELHFTIAANINQPVWSLSRTCFVLRNARVWNSESNCARLLGYSSKFHADGQNFRFHLHPSLSQSTALSIQHQHSSIILCAARQRCAYFNFHKHYINTLVKLSVFFGVSESVNEILYDVFSRRSHTCVHGLRWEERKNTEIYREKTCGGAEHMNESSQSAVNINAAVKLSGRNCVISISSLARGRAACKFEINTMHFIERPQCSSSHALCARP